MRHVSPPELVIRPRFAVSHNTYRFNRGGRCEECEGRCLMHTKDIEAKEAHHALVLLVLEILHLNFYLFFSLQVFSKSGVHYVHAKKMNRYEMWFVRSCTLSTQGRLRCEVLAQRSCVIKAAMRGCVYGQISSNFHQFG